MKTQTCKLASALMVAVVAVCGHEDSIQGAIAESTDQALRSVGEIVVRLLETGAVKKFADEIAPSLVDWQSVRITNAGPEDDPLGPDLQKQLSRGRRQVEASARRVLEKANALGLSPQRVRFKVNGVLAEPSGSSHTPGFKPLPWVPETVVVLSGEPRTTQDADRLRGEYRLTLGGMGGGLKFAGGWHFSNGIRWASFPSGVADQKAESQLALLNKIWADHELTLKDDPALGALGQVLTRFLRERDLKVFASEAVEKLDDIWGKVKKQCAERNEPLPPRKEFERSLEKSQEKILQSASGVLEQLKRFGVRFAEGDLQLKAVEAESVYTYGEYGTLSETRCGQLRFIFAPRSDFKSNAGRPASGNFILTASMAIRELDRWFIADAIRWQELPRDLLSASDAANLEFENYVAKHRALPPGTKAPEAEFIRLNDGSKVKTTDFRGKILVLEFWSTSCGPCQEPLAKLQTLRAKHPEWNDRVEIVTVSIDDTAKEARQHLQKRGWTKTLNLWAGKGNWFAPSAKAFRVSGIPTAYVIDAEGKIALGGHPFGDQIVQSVNSLIK